MKTGKWICEQTKLSKHLVYDGVFRSFRTGSITK